MIGLPALRFALRTLRKNPGFAVTALLTLGLGIGANTAIFTVIRAVLLKPLEYRDTHRLVRISGGATLAGFDEMQDAAHSYSALGAVLNGVDSITLSGGDGLLIAVALVASYIPARRATRIDPAEAPRAR